MRTVVHSLLKSYTTSWMMGLHNALSVLIVEEMVEHATDSL